jgi:hypothetical protein
MPKQPLAEVFGFPIDNLSKNAVRQREQRLCPFNNKVPNCTKDEANNPLGVCSVFEGAAVAITCPIRFRENWLIAQDAAEFFFPPKTKWTSLVEVRLNDRHGNSAGNIDIVLVAYNEKGKVTDFGSCEVQAVYISGNIREPFEHYMEHPARNSKMDWVGQPNYPRPDYLSSSRKRLAPQLHFKGGIFKAWGKKHAVAIQRELYDILPIMTEVDKSRADVAWMIYDLKFDKRSKVFELVQSQIIYTAFPQAFQKLPIASGRAIGSFVEVLQSELSDKLEYPPDASGLTDISITI